VAGVDPAWVHVAEMEDVGGAVAVVGAAEADQSRGSGRTAEEIALQAARRAIADTGLTPADIDGVMCSRAPGQLDGRAFRSAFRTSHDLWESADGGPGVHPFHAAALALREGRATYILNTYGVAWATMRSGMVGGPGDAHAQERYKQNLEVPYGWFPQPVYFACVARRHMHEFGTTEEQLGAVAVATRRNANATPTAVLHGKPLTLADYLASPPIAEPFRREDCCLVSDGGGAYVMTTPERARDLPHPVVELAGVAHADWTTGWHFAQQPAFTATPQAVAAPLAFAMAACSPADVDVYSCYDAFTIITVMQLEDSGFCEKGAGGAFAAEVGLAHDGGGLPTNTHGGLLSHAYVNGIAHVVEVVAQLRGTAAAQVPGARIGGYGSFTGAGAGTVLLRRAG
jgi:acetyl-CoA acetyltransferase